MLHSIDFVKVAEACGWRAVHIEDPTRCHDQLQEALRMEGPVLIEAVVDANEPPLPGKIKPTQAKHLAEALRRGEPNRVRIGLTIGHEMLDESTFAASPYGIIGRAAERLSGVGSGDGDGKGKQ